MCLPRRLMRKHFRFGWTFYVSSKFVTNRRTPNSFGSMFLNLFFQSEKSRLRELVQRHTHKELEAKIGAVYN